MKKSIMLLILLTLLCGCAAQKAERTGFLSTYDNLQQVSDSSWRYLDKSVAGKYSGFIVDPVEIHFKKGAKAIKAKSEGKMTEQDIQDLANYFHSAIVKAITDAGYKVEYKPGSGIARIRAAITDAEETNVALAAVPQIRMLTGAGVGDAAMETEVIDSLTGKQIGAVIETKAGSRVPFTGLSEWGGAKSAIDEWAKRLRARLEEAHGLKTR